MLFLSIHPRFVDKILAGEKTVELRRRRPRSVAGDLIAVYATSPEKCLRGIVQITEVLVAGADDMWLKVRSRAGVAKAEFDSYFDGSKRAVGIAIGKPIEFVTPIPLAQLRDIWPNFQPPQGFRYLDDEQVRFIQSLTSRSAKRAA